MFVPIYVVSVFALALAALAAWRAAAALAAPRVVSTCVTTGLLLYFASLLPGVAGRLSAATAGACLLILSTLSTCACAALARRFPAIPPMPSIDVHRTPQLHRNFVAMSIGFAALVANWPLLRYMWTLPRQLRDFTVPLPWDTVSYHLPGLIDFQQRGTFWYLGSRFSSYPFGYELIYGYPLLFFRSHWSLVLAQAYAVLFLVAAVFLLSNILTHALFAKKHDSDSMRPAFVGVLTTLVALALFCGMFPSQFYEFGKNDVFLCACLLSGLGLLLESETQRSQDQSSAGAAWLRRRRAFLVTLAAGALGLAAATKPTGLLFMPLFAISSVFLGRRGPLGESLPTGLGEESRDRWSVGQGVLVATALTIGMVAVSGFWYFRNLLLLGRPVDESHSRYFMMAIIRNLTNRRLYLNHKGLGAILFACLAPVALILLARFAQRRSSEVSAAARPQGIHRSIPGVVKYFAAFELMAGAVLTVTPAVVWKADFWQLRLGMSLFLTAGIVAGLLVSWAALLDWRLPWIRRPNGRVMLATSATAVLTALPLHWMRKQNGSPPNLDAVREEVSATDVYRWAQRLHRPARIYAAGLRPYGLYGKDWRNILFYDLHSHLLDAHPAGQPSGSQLFYDLRGEARAHEVTGPARLLAVLRTFSPDYIVIGVEPDIDWPVRKPLVDWIHGQPYFMEVYRDNAASAFEVRDGWQSLLPQYPDAQRPVRMGG